MQAKKRAKAVKFGKKIDKPEPVIEQEQKEEKETPQTPQPEEPKIPQEEETKITEIQEVTIETQHEPPTEPPVESPVPSPEEPTTETQEATLKTEANDTYIVETRVKKKLFGILHAYFNHLLYNWPAKYGRN